MTNVVSLHPVVRTNGHLHDFNFTLESGTVLFSIIPYVCYDFTLTQAPMCEHQPPEVFKLMQNYQTNCTIQTQQYKL